jgi:hypothetical protein
VERQKKAYTVPSYVCPTFLASNLHRASVTMTAMLNIKSAKKIISKALNVANLIVVDGWV